MHTRRVTSAVSPEPFDVGQLSVGDGHRLYYEQFGASDGLPIVYLHGGPGSGSTPSEERLRQHLGIDRWAVFGMSWGSVLAMAYAESHPDRVTALVLAAVSTGTAEDIAWLTVHVGRFFPQQWLEFRDHVPLELRHLRLVEAYNRLLMDSVPQVREAAASAWCRWEDAHVATTKGA